MTQNKAFSRFMSVMLVAATAVLFVTMALSPAPALLS